MRPHRASGRRPIERTRAQAHRRLTQLHHAVGAMVRHLPAPVVAVLAPLRSAITRTSAWQWVKSGDLHLARAAAVVAPVFDREFYLATYGPSLDGREPVVHYLESG